MLRMTLICVLNCGRRSVARTALARAKQLDLDRTVYIKEGHFESYCYGPYIRIPLRPIPEGKP
jgi:hypothetical protein